MTPLQVMKGHGTGNDFVLIDDRAGETDISADLVRQLCDRHRGIGADGVIRLAPSADEPDAAGSLAENAGARWFMDYRNADGSIAEMCGNGVRVLAALLLRLGEWDGVAVLPLATRAGVRSVTLVDAVVGTGPWFSVGMGRGVFEPADAPQTVVAVEGIDGARPAMLLNMGNPHTVIALAARDELAAAGLHRPPIVTPVPPFGTNVELVVPMGESIAPDGAVVGEITMRVHERGVGETQSCGTGVCAVALAVRAWGGAGAPDRWLVHVPGGTVLATIGADNLVTLAGPAVLVADISVDRAALS